jgi:type IX secretion system PorP/SprF family membrane protein
VIKRGLNILLLLFLFVLAENAFAQDLHFSQYYFSPLSLNPAYTGNYRGDYRLFGNYRSQWRGLDKGYNTYSAGGDMNFFPNNVNISPGLIFISDKSSLNFSITKILPSIAIHRKIAGFKLHAGIQPGFVIKSIDFYKHSFPNQLNWNTGAFDNTLPNDEANVGQRFNYFDLNAGVGASRKFGKLEGEIGFAMFHLTRPPETFLDNKKNRLEMRQNYNVALTADLGSYILRAHSLCGYTTKASDWVSGFTFEYVLSRNAYFVNTIFLGGMWRDGLKRNSDAGIVTAGLNYSHYTLGFSYDITLSELKTAVDSRGGLEIAFIYRAKSTRITKKIIPCERY